MKKWLSLFCLFFVTVTVSRAEDISLSTGQVLRNACVSKFFAGEFVIEHNGGIAHIPWAQMPESYQAGQSLPSAAQLAQERAVVDGQIRLRRSAIEKTKADKAEADRVAKLPKVLIYATVSQVKGDFIRLDCVPADISHQAMLIDIASSSQRDIHTPRDATTQSWKVRDTITLVAREDGTFTYTTIAGEVRTIPSVSHWQPLPQYSKVTPGSVPLLFSSQ